MAKNANAKNWSLQLGELNKRWSDQPFDLTGPSAPTIAAFGGPTETTVGVQVTAAAVDNRTGISAYIVEISENGTDYSVHSIASVAQATAGHVLTGLNSSSTYSIRVKGRDGSFAQNIGAASNVIQQTTTAPAGNETWWPNLPIANISMLQGNSTFHLLDPNQHQAISEHDMYMFQGFNMLTPSRCATRKTNLAAIHALNQNGRRTRCVLYVSQQQVHKVESDSHTSPMLALINHATKGNSNWWLRRVAPSNAQIEAPFNPTLFWLVNMGRSGLLNSLGQTYHTALAKEYKALLDASDDAHDVLSELDGLFLDDSHFRMQMPMSTGNGSVVVTDPDINEDGVAENIVSYAAGATGGSRMWCEGHLDHKAAIKAEFGNNFMYFPNGSEIGTYYYDGDGTPPLPISDMPMYQKLEMNLQEQLVRFGLGFGPLPTGTGTYQYNAGGSMLHACRIVHINRLMLQADNLSAGGRSWVVIHFSGPDRTLNQDDYEMCRFVAGFALVQERLAVAVNRAGIIPISLDELKLELGAPIGSRSMGTMNESTAGYTLRTANFSNGVGRFYWAEFQKALVVMRGDNPPVGSWPLTGAAVSCTLPSPGSGKKWQRINAASYTNPITGLSMNNQSPSINNGADVGSTVSMRPFTALFLRRVDV